MEVLRLTTPAEREASERTATVVRLLEAALIEAKEGRWDGALLILEGGGKFSSRWTGAEDVFRRVGKLEQLKYDWLSGD